MWGRENRHKRDLMSLWKSVKIGYTSHKFQLLTAPTMLISLRQRQFIKEWKYLWKTGTNWLLEIWDYGPLVRIRDWTESLNAPVLSVPLRWHMTLKQVTAPQKWCCFTKTHFLQRFLRVSLLREFLSVRLHNEWYGWLKNQSHAFMKYEGHSLLS